MAATMNGTPRKQLADQLDRLDGVIDLLADNLNQAVADAAKDGVREAVLAVARELLADPAVRDRLFPQPTPPAPATPTRPSAITRLRAGLARLRAAATSAVTDVVGRARQWVGAQARRLTAPVRAVHAAARAVARVTTGPAVRAAVTAAAVAATVTLGLALAHPVAAGGAAGLAAGVGAAVLTAARARPGDIPTN